MPFTSETVENLKLDDNTYPFTKDLFVNDNTSPLKF